MAIGFRSIMTAVRFFGPANNFTGYGTAVTNFAKAFSMSSIDTKFKFKTTSKENPFIKDLNHYQGKTNIDFFLHCPPYNHHNGGSYKIAYFYWEADTLPRNWSRSINKVNELWVPCDLVRNACIKAGFAGRITIVPTPCDDWQTSHTLEIPSSFSDEYVVGDDTYKFYSIFQWQNRKGWRTLLNSYYRSFGPNDDAVLILKVNPLNLPGYTAEMIRPDITNLKRKLNLKYYPPVFLSENIVPLDHVKALHNTGDCYVSSHHGEGWGMPIHDAMRIGNQIIVTKYGGVTEYLDKNSAHIINHSVGPVSNMGWSPLYGNYQNWAHPSATHLSDLFKDVYVNHKSYTNMPIEAKKIASTMTIPDISRIIEKELKRGRS